MRIQKKIVLTVFLALAPIFAATESTLSSLSTTELLSYIADMRGEKLPVKSATLYYQYYINNPSLLPPNVVSALISSSKKEEDFPFAKATGDLPVRYPFSSQKFPIYYYTSGVNAVPDSDAVSLLTDGSWLNEPNGIPDFVEWVAQAADSSYNVMRTVFGYDDSNDSVKIVMKNLSENIYALTYDSRLMEIDNDFSFFDKKKIDLKGRYQVTLAHELYHVLQFHILQQYEMNFFAEPSAVWMEEKIYPHVDDYLQYIKSGSSLFINPNQQIDAPSFSNYDRVVWPMFLDERFDARVNRFAWEEYGAGKNDFNEVFSSSLIRAGYSGNMDSVLAEFAEWLFFTGTRAAYKNGFRDRALFPTAPLSSVITGDETYKKAGLQPRGMVFFDRGNQPKRVWIETRSDSIPIGAVAIRLTDIDSSNSSQKYFPNPFYLLADTLARFLLLSNRSSAEKEIVIDGRGPVYSMNSGRIFEKKISGNMKVVLTVNVAVICTLENLQSGELDTVAVSLLNAMQNGGLASFTQTSYLRDGFETIFLLKTDPSIEKLIDSGVVAMTFVATTDRGAAYTFAALDSSFAICGTATLNRFNDSRELPYANFRDKINTSVSGEGEFYIAESWITHKVTSTVFPSPVRISGGEAFIVTDEKDLYSELLLYSMAGKLIKRLPALKAGYAFQVSDPINAQKGQTIFKWNLRDSNGIIVAPGIYFYTITNYSYPTNGKTQLSRGKVAVLAK